MKETDVGDALEGLIVDEEQIARTELAEGLRPYLRLTRGGELVFEPAFDALKAQQKVCVTLLGVRAAALMGLRDDAGSSPTELVQLSGLPPGTIRPKLSELLKLRLVAKKADRYEIPSHSLGRAMKSITPGART